MYFCLCCAPPTPTAGWATSEWVAGRAVEDGPFPTRIAPKICSTNERTEITLLQLVGYQLVEVKELADYRLMADVFGYGAEAVILGYAADVVLAIVLAQGLVVPCDALPYLPSVRSWLLHNLVERCADTDKLFLCHAAICGRSVAVIYFVCFHIQ